MSNSSPSQIHTISSTVPTVPTNTNTNNVSTTSRSKNGTTKAKNSNLSPPEQALVHVQRKHRLYIIAIVALLVFSFLVIAAIVAIVVTFLVNKSPPKQTSTTVFNCSYGYNGENCDECGVTFASPNVKIVGGVAATKNSWPAYALIIFSYKADVFLADLQITYKLDRSYLCGGTLITRKTVLTAAHCFQKTIEFEYNGTLYTANVTPNKYYPTYESMVKVYLGVNTLSSSGTRFSVNMVKTHESYNDASHLNDIALLRLSNEASLGPSVQIACLPNPSENTNMTNRTDGGFYPTKYGQDVWAIGVGSLGTDSSSQWPESLQNVKMTLYDGATQCSQVAATTPKSWSSQLCAGELRGGKDTCQGDSGGGLFVNDQVNNVSKYVVVGITSYGVGCALPRLPGIYTRISYYLNWIKQNSA